MTRLRPVLVVALAVTLAGAGAAAVLPAVQNHLDRPSREQAQTVAHVLPAPTGATVSTICHGDGQVACWETSAPVLDVEREMVLALQEQVGKVSGVGEVSKAVVSSCDEVRVGARGEALADSCFVRARFGDHGTFVFIDPLTTHDKSTGTTSVIGARVSLSAG